MRIRVVRIREIRDESKYVKTFLLDTSFEFTPGQFIMVWIPGIDEKPFALSSKDGFTVQIYGEFTKKMFSLKPGDKIGIRGPFGRGYHLKKDSKRILLISGGIGISSLIPLAEEARNLGIEVDILAGFRSKDYMAFIERIKSLSRNYLIATDDGSFGVKGFVTDFIEKFLKKHYDQVFVCGPEIMMKKVFDKISFKFETQYSLSRYIKCGIGICGSCVIDGKGLLVCKDGPVFYDRELLGTSFGYYKRDEYGRRIYFK